MSDQTVPLSTTTAQRMFTRSVCTSLGRITSFGWNFSIYRNVSFGWLVCISWFIAILPITSAWAQTPARNDAPAVYLGFDGAYGQKTNTAAQAIEFGLKSAIEDINAAGGVLGGRPLKLITTDNKGISARGKDNFVELAQQKDLVAVFGGKYSPVTVESLPDAHKFRIPIISVWGSADQITENGMDPSYAFRVSLKDSWGVTAMLKRIVNNLNAKTACALLPNTAWGRSSDAVIKSQAMDLGLSIPVIRWYNWGDTSFAASYAQCLSNGARAMLFVGNEREAAILIKEIAARPVHERLPVISHWGTVGGVLHELVGKDLDAVRFEVIQTFTFVNNNRPLAVRLANAAIKAGGYATVADIPSPVGIAQAYDAARLVALAIDQAKTTNGEEVRNALEQLPPYQGAIKDYAPAFTATRHDALDASSIVFVKLTPGGALIPLD